MSLPEVVTAGETMLLALPTQPGRLRHAQDLQLRVGGAESNFAISLSRLGISAGWMGYVGANETGRMVIDRLRGEGVDTSRVSMIEGSNTGLYLREKLGQEVRVYYYREGSAASMMAPGAFDAGYMDGAKFLHLTGITPALSDGCRDFVKWLVEEGKSRGVGISFDVNYRSKLWSPEDCREFIEEILPAVDVLFVSEEEAEALWGTSDRELLTKLSSEGPTEILLKRGGRGCQALIDGGFLEQGAFEVSEVDPVGAGDAFAAGYIAGGLWNTSLEERLRIANAMGACSIMTLGDYEGLPDREELETFAGGAKRLGR
ncbi:MAG: sugar kinase [Rubrobacteraceae bacterium]